MKSLEEKEKEISSGIYIHAYTIMNVHACDVNVDQQKLEYESIAQRLPKRGSASLAVKSFLNTMLEYYEVKFRQKMYQILINACNHRIYQIMRLNVKGGRRTRN